MGLGAALEVGTGLLPGGEQARRLDDHVDPERAPVDQRRVALREHRDPVPVDVGREGQVLGLFGGGVERHGRVDIAFTNAGISPPEDDSILDTDLDVWSRVQEVNLTSVYLCCKYVIPHMRRQGRGSIINTASFVAVMGAVMAAADPAAATAALIRALGEAGALAS